jgi:hypothetical protein
MTVPFSRGGPKLVGQRGAIAVGLSAEREGITVTFVDIETYADGWLLRLRVEAPERDFRLVQLPRLRQATVLDLEVLDESGVRYGLWYRHARASDHVVTVEYACTPALQDPRPGLTLRIESIALHRAQTTFGPADSVETWSGPWDIELREITRPSIDPPRSLAAEANVNAHCDERHQAPLRSQSGGRCVQHRSRGRQRHVGTTASRTSIARASGLHGGTGTRS